MSEIIGIDCEEINLISDKDTRIILRSIITVPKSISQLCIECNIPTSTAYRKMQKLSDYRIIRKIGIINGSGKRETSYKSNTGLLKILKCEGYC
jgi:Fe2+ or Zn2+ uptake regulation protein